MGLTIRPEATVEAGVSAAQAPLLVFLHVPKSAGTTLREIIIDQHPPGSLHTSYEEGFAPEAVAGGYLALTPQLQKFKEVMCGHFSYGVHQYLPRPVIYYTLLRDPVKRVISHYQYVVETRILPDPDHPDRQRVLDGKFTLEDYVCSGYCVEMENGQTRQLAGEIGLYERTPFGACTRDVYEEARRNLDENIAITGLTERFDESLLLIQRLCGWQPPYYIRQNVTRAPLRPADIPPSTLQAIRESNRYDQMLFDHAAKVLEMRVIAQGPAFAGEVRRFRERNRRFGPHLRNVWNFARKQRRRVRRLTGRAPRPDAGR